MQYFRRRLNAAAASGTEPCQPAPPPPLSTTSRTNGGTAAVSGCASAAPHASAQLGSVTRRCFNAHVRCSRFLFRQFASKGYTLSGGLGFDCTSGRGVGAEVDQHRCSALAGWRSLWRRTRSRGTTSGTWSKVSGRTEQCPVMGGGWQGEGCVHCLAHERAPGLCPLFWSRQCFSEWSRFISTHACSRLLSPIRLSALLVSKVKPNCGMKKNAEHVMNLANVEVFEQRKDSSTAGQTHGLTRLSPNVSLFRPLQWFCDHLFAPVAAQTGRGH